MDGIKAQSEWDTSVCVRDTIDYLVWHKIPASEDMQIRTPVTNALADAALRQYQMLETDITP